MTLLVVLVVFGVLLGAASYTSLPVLMVGVGLVGAWLLAFAVREGISHTRNR
ncbi:hypothetical protein [Streptomyces sp. NBC_01262]|jgi:tRNA A37 threonylcarbamoyladenosine dehydratase|uniref:hypothetical protein n=1 Tax=Streptomyces sp. NBC_01262 TaxID=2903803 RepID=UPI002E315677|nr:hypothetical protein [Streptomyces sp. NBC_01262]